MKNLALLNHIASYSEALTIPNSASYHFG